MAEIKQVQSTDDFGQFSPTEAFEFHVGQKLVGQYQPGMRYRLTSLNMDFIKQKADEGKVKWL